MTVKPIKRSHKGNRIKLQIKNQKIQNCFYSPEYNQWLNPHYSDDSSVQYKLFQNLVKKQKLKRSKTQIQGFYINYKGKKVMSNVKQGEMLQKLFQNDKKFKLKKPKRKLCEIKQVPGSDIIETLNRTIFQIILSQPNKEEFSKKVLSLIPKDRNLAEIDKTLLRWMEVYEKSQKKKNKQIFDEYLYHWRDRKIPKELKQSPSESEEPDLF